MTCTPIPADSTAIQTLEPISVGAAQQSPFHDLLQHIFSYIISGNIARQLLTSRDHFSKEIAFQGKPITLKFLDGKSIVFQASSAPEVVFKAEILNPLLGAMMTKDKFKNAKIASSFINEQKLCHVMVPQAVLTEVNIEKQDAPIPVIIEEHLDFLEITHENLSDAQLAPILKDLTAVIIKLRLCDLQWRNLPLVRTEGDSLPKIALIDLENLLGPGQEISDFTLYYGIGNLLDSGLTPKQQQIIITECARWGFDFEQFDPHAFLAQAGIPPMAGLEKWRPLGELAS